MSDTPLTHALAQTRNMDNYYDTQVIEYKNEYFALRATVREFLILESLYQANPNTKVLHMIMEIKKSLKAHIFGGEHVIG